jgi:uncharacterized membrane protein
MEVATVTEDKASGISDYLFLIVIILLALIIAWMVVEYFREKKKVKQLKHVGGTKFYDVYMDKDNGVTYLFGIADNESSSGIGITVMYNPDGTIKVHPDFKPPDEIKEPPKIT